MTPAIKLLQKQKVNFAILQYKHDKASESYGLEAAEKLQLNPASVFKTLVAVIDDNELVVAIIPVNKRLSFKAVATACQAKKAAMAEPQKVMRTTGYVLGGVSPLGQKKRLRTVIDESASNLTTIHVSAGKRGVEIALSPQDLASLCGARFALLCESC